MKEPIDLNKKRPGPWDEMELVDKDHDKLKLIDEKTGELLLECKVGDKYHQLLLEIGLNTILERAIFEYESGGDFLEYVKNRPMQEWENNLDKEWTPLEEPTGDDVAKALGHMDKDGEFIE